MSTTKQRAGGRSGLKSGLGFEQVVKKKYNGIVEKSANNVDEAVNLTEAPVADNVDSTEETADRVNNVEVVKEKNLTFEKPKSSKGKKTLRGRKRRSISKSLERKIITMYRAGKSPREIAEVLGISRSSVYRRVRNALKN
jgi:transposase-like protein